MPSDLRISLDPTQWLMWQFDLQHKRQTVGFEVGEMARGAAQAILNQVRHNITVAPPPRYPTRRRARRPRYRDQWRVEVNDSGPFNFEFEIGTDVPYGWRFERGFVGVDAIGRHYVQMPRPVAGPAADLIEPVLVEAIAEIGGRIP